MLNYYTQIITFFVIFQLLIFSVFLLNGNRRYRISNQILAGILISQALWMFESSLFHVGKSYFPYFIHFLYTGESLSFFWGPGLFLYISYLTRKNNQFRKSDLLYFLPMLIHFGFMCYKFHFRPTAVKFELLRTDQVLNHIELSISWMVYCLNNVIFNIAAIFTLYRYKQEAKTNHASPEKLNFTLLTIILFGFLSKTTIECIRYIAFLSGMYDILLPLYSACMIDSYIFTTILIFSTLKRPELFNQMKGSLKYGSSPLTLGDVQFYSEKLKIYMREKKPFLEETINLETLATGIDLAPRYLSQVINQAYEQNFFDFINRYRIDYAVEQLSNFENRKTISEIYYEAGFKSKATFYKAFKKHQNITPTLFRKENLLISSN
jgi:AraC-like DNA-binding protein